MAHLTKDRRWLLAIPAAGVLVGLLWLAFEPIFGVVSLFWLPVVIAVGVGAMIWRWGAERVLNLLQQPLIRGLAIFVLLLALYVYIVQLGWSSLDFLAEFMGVTKLVAVVIILTVTLLLTPLPAVIITLFKPTGIPIDEKFVVRGSRGLAAIILTILLIRGVNVESWNKDIARGLEAAKAMVVALMAPVTPATTSRVIEVGSEKTEVLIPRRHTFQIDSQDTVFVENVLGERFLDTPDGKVIRLRDNVRVENYGDPIPGFKLYLQGWRGRPTKVVFSYWP